LECKVEVWVACWKHTVGQRRQQQGISSNTSEIERHQLLFPLALPVSSLYGMYVCPCKSNGQLDECNPQSFTHWTSRSVLLLQQTGRPEARYSAPFPLQRWPLPPFYLVLLMCNLCDIARVLLHSPVGSAHLPAYTYARTRESTPHPQISRHDLDRMISDMITRVIALSKFSRYMP